MFRSLALGFALVMTQPITAQIVFGEMGFQVTAMAGTAGDACWGFSCAPRSLVVQGGETLNMIVRAPLGAPFVIVAGFGATSCLSVPGVWNELVVDPPLLVLFAGSVTQRNFTRFCYDGYELRTLAVPTGLPSGVQLALQAGAFIGTPLQPNTGFGLASAVLVQLR